MDPEIVTAHEDEGAPMGALEEARAFFGWVGSLLVEAREAVADDASSPLADAQFQAALRAAWREAPASWRVEDAAYVAPSMLAGLEWVGEETEPAWYDVAARMRRAGRHLDRARARAERIVGQTTGTAQDVARRAVEAVAVVAQAGASTLDRFGEGVVRTTTGLGLAAVGVAVMLMMARR